MERGRCQRNVALMYALRADWGIGSTANPTAWAATNVTLTGSDAAGESGFNFGNKWSDNTFAHPNAAYSTGAFSMRTPQGYPSWKFAGNSLTVNSGGRLLFNGWGTTGVVTINNLTVNGGTVRHDQFAQDLFQLAGNNIALAGTATFEAANGDIRVLAPVSGTGSLVKSGGNAVTLTGNNTYTGATTVSAGKLILNNVGLPNTSGVNVSTAATLNVRGNITTGGTLTSSGIVDLVDDVLNTLTVSGGLGLNNSTLNLQLGSASGDRIAAVGSSTVSGTNTINVTFLPGQNPTNGSSYTLVTAAGGLSAANFNNAVNKPASLGFYQFTLSTPTPTALLMNVTGNPTPAVAYWTGQASVASADANNNWGTGPSINKSNWSTNVAGNADPLQLPGSTTSVIFNAANATGVAGTLTTRLDSAYAIGGLTIDVPAAPGDCLNGPEHQRQQPGDWKRRSHPRLELHFLRDGQWRRLDPAQRQPELGEQQQHAEPERRQRDQRGIRRDHPELQRRRHRRRQPQRTDLRRRRNALSRLQPGRHHDGHRFQQLHRQRRRQRRHAVRQSRQRRQQPRLQLGQRHHRQQRRHASRRANGLFGWDGSQDRPITVNAGGSLVALGAATTDVGVGSGHPQRRHPRRVGHDRVRLRLVPLRQRDRQAPGHRKLHRQRQRVKFGDSNATIEVAAGKTLNFTGTVMDTTAGGISHLNKSGPGVLSMTGSNTYSGETAVGGGTLNVTGSINSTGVVSVGDGNAASGTLNVGSAGAVIGYEVWFGQPGRRKAPPPASATLRPAASSTPSRGLSSAAPEIPRAAAP